MKLSLCMIVKNEEDNIERSLRSAASGLGDALQEVVIYDTGSTDRTVSICERFGARVERGFWDDDFSRARNASIAMGSNDWSMILDADDELIVDVVKLMTFVESTYAPNTVYAMRVSSIDDRGSERSANFLVRILKPAESKYVGEIHEQVVLTSGLQPNVVIIPPEIARITHFGYIVDSPLHIRRERNLRCAIKQINRVTSASISSHDEIVEATANLGAAFHLCEMRDLADIAFEHLIAMGPGENKDLWLNALQKRAYHLLDADRCKESDAVRRSIVNVAGNSSFTDWLQALKFYRACDFQAAWLLLRNIRSVSTSLGVDTPTKQILMMRAHSAFMTGEYRDAAHSLSLLRDEGPLDPYLSRIADRVGSFCEKQTAHSPQLSNLH